MSSFPSPGAAKLRAELEGGSRLKRTLSPWAELRSLAGKYRNAAGKAFSRGEDESALAYRTLADVFDALDKGAEFTVNGVAVKLLPLPSSGK